MRLIYRPKTGPEREFTFDLDAVTAPEAELLESIGGTSWEGFQGWQQAYRDNRIRARRAAIWLALRREGERHDFDSFAPMANQIDFDYDVTELVNLREFWQTLDTDDARLQASVIEGMLARRGWTPPADEAEPEAGEAEPVDPKPRSSSASRRSRKKTPDTPEATPSDEQSTDGPSPES